MTSQQIKNVVYKAIKKLDVEIGITTYPNDPSKMSAYRVIELDDEDYAIVYNGVGLQQWVNRIVRPDVVTDYIMEKLSQHNVEGRVKINGRMSDAVPEDMNLWSGYCKSLWRMDIEVTGQIVLASDELLNELAVLLINKKWKEGRKVTKVSQSKKFVLGQEVVITSHKKRSPHRYWFLTSYRCGGIGSYALYRSDGEVISADKVSPVYQEDLVDLGR